MTEFWHEHLEEPCQCVCSKARSAGAFIDGDAAVARGPGDHAATASGSGVQLFEGGAPDGHKRTSASFDATPHIAFDNPRSKQKASKVHNTADGAFRTNRTGYTLCAGWQNGTCTTSYNGVICGADPNKRHQCAKCLSADHGSSHPVACARTPKESASAGRFPNQGGKGKGKKGKGKKGGQW